jgi:hypothetical protein
MVQVDYRFFGQVVATSYLHRFGAWLMHLFMVQVGAWLMHFFMVEFDYRLLGTGCYILSGAILLVQVYSSISHSDIIIVVPSFYFYIMAVGRGKDEWL